ncbi:MAG: lysozyme inhibitor LprI family protein [Pseudomonadota bacterium]
MKRLFFACLLAALPGLAAADNCDQPNLTGFDSVYCFSKIYIGEDNRLNANYQALRARLGSVDRNTLLQAQRGWIRFRDATCMTGPTTVNVDCALNVTRARADFLSARIVECNTVGCASSMLSRY